jgi:DnaK suppressor protein
MKSRGVMEDKRNELLQKLSSRKAQLEQEIHAMKESQREYSDQLSDDKLKDEFDFAQRETSIQYHYSLIEKKSQELKRINRLIVQISDNEAFGMCEECGRPIPLERLLIVPDAELCVSCQRELEHFDHMRKPSVQSSRNATSKRQWDVENFTFHDDLDDDTIDYDLELLPVIESVGTDDPDLLEEQTESPDQKTERLNLI